MSCLGPFAHWALGRALWLEPVSPPPCPLRCAFCPYPRDGPVSRVQIESLLAAVEAKAGCEWILVQAAWTPEGEALIRRLAEELGGRIRIAAMLPRPPERLPEGADLLIVRLDALSDRVRSRLLGDQGLDPRRVLAQLRRAASETGVALMINVVYSVDDELNRDPSELRRVLELAIDSGCRLLIESVPDPAGRLRVLAEDELRELWRMVIDLAGEERVLVRGVFDRLSEGGAPLPAEELAPLLARHPMTLREVAASLNVSEAEAERRIEDLERKNLVKFVRGFYFGTRP